MSIVTLATFKDYVRDETNGANDAVLQGYLDAASEALGNACGREWVLAGSATARLFPPSNTDLLVINDCTTVTVVVHNGATLTAGTDYRAEPLNARSASRAVPYYQLRRGVGTWYSSTTLGTISVTATWGWSAFPYQIVEACKVLGKELCNNQDVRLGIVAVSDAAISGIRTNKVVRDAVNAFPHPNSIGIAT